MRMMSEKRLPNGIGVNFDEDERGTEIRAAYKGAVIQVNSALKEPLSSADREFICTFLAERRELYFRDDGVTITATSTHVLVSDLTRAGFSL